MVPTFVFFVHFVVKVRSSHNTQAANDSGNVEPIGVSISDLDMECVVTTVHDHEITVGYVGVL